ncbi:hypothetical protein [Reyranella soli]|uniref:hypothetical protein n=1 Tax=Reyranella soli TaxID=1230389 RepID=UPI0011BEE8D1|nr:hypothetical protein [Reyranella soli]
MSKRPDARGCAAIAGNCRASKGGRERRQCRHELGVAGVLQEEMHQPEHDQQSNERQLQPARQREVERHQQHQLLQRLLLEVGQTPLGDQAQGLAEAEDARRHQDRFRFIGRDAGRHQRGNAELGPGDEQGAPLGGVSRTDQGIEREGSRQQQAEREAAMHVGPQEHDQQQPEIGRPALLDGTHQARDPQEDQREHQHVRAGQQVRRRHDRRGRREQRRRQRPDVAHQQARQQREGEADHGGRKNGHAAPAAEVEGQRQQDLRQPLLGDPGLAGEGEGVGVDRGHRAVRQDPVADGDVPMRVGVAQERQARRVVQEHEHRKADQDRPRHRPDGAGARAGGRPAASWLERNGGAGNVGHQ